MSPKDHPNASIAIIAGYLATALIFGAKKLGLALSPEEASTAAVALIGVVLAFGNAHRRAKAHAAPAVKKPTPPAGK